LCNGVDIHNAPVLSTSNYHAGGGTALLDAVGQAIDNAGNRLRNIPEISRPGKVVFIVVTDGEENSSKSYTKEQIKNLINEQTKKYNWEFTYLGANVDAFHEAGSIGFAATHIANYGANTKGVHAVYQIASSNLNTLRSRTSAGAAASMDFAVDDVAELKSTI
jgi:hypothetical protein